MANIVLIVNVKIEPGYTETLMPAMQQNAEQSVLEDGCYQFDILINEDDENEFVFFEVYKDTDALAAHRKTPHYPDLFQFDTGIGRQGITHCPNLPTYGLNSGFSASG